MSIEVNNVGRQPYSSLERVGLSPFMIIPDLASTTVASDNRIKRRGTMKHNIAIVIGILESLSARM